MNKSSEFENENTGINSFGRVVAFVAGFILVALVILGLARGAFILHFSWAALFEISDIELRDFLLKSGLIDIKVVLTLVLPLMLLKFLGLFHRRLAAVLHWPCVIWGSIVELWLIVTAVINFYYFKTYDHVTGAMLFAFADENPQAVLSTVWQDYPVVQGVLGLICAITLAVYSSLKLAKLLAPVFSSLKPKGAVSGTLFGILFCAVYFLGMRGSVGTFPLREANIGVSTNVRVNATVPNGAETLRWAYLWYRSANKVPVVEVSRIYDELETLGWKPKTPHESLPYEAFVAHTKRYSADFKLPDVSISLLESFSSHILSFDGENLDLLGRLREESAVAGAYYMPVGFLSGGVGTADSIMRLLVSVPDNSYSTGPYAQTHNLFNVLLPFKRMGYRIIYITGDNGSWRNIKNFLLSKGVDEVVDRQGILLQHPEATYATWGVDDEYIYLTALDIIRDQKQKNPEVPLLIFTQSITNHPPFRLPPNRTNYQVTLPESISSRFPYDNTAELFSTLRYSADMFGGYARALRTEPLLHGNVVVAATGDHNMRGIGYSAHRDETVLGYMVPFYFYLPSSMRDDVRDDLPRFGSHKDIIPTILSRFKVGNSFLTTGCDLLGVNSSCLYPAAFNSELAVPNPQGDYACILQGAHAPFNSIALLPPPSSLTNPARLDEAGFDCSKAKAYKSLISDMYFYGIKHQEEIERDLKAVR